jgi:hypothetical protein
MSFSLGVEGRAAIEAIAACDRVAPRLLDLIAQHDHAATVARSDWCGPHRDTFEQRFAAVQGALVDGGFWVLHVRHAAATRLAELTLAAQEAETLLQPTGPR